MDAATVVKLVANIRHALDSRVDAYPNTLYWGEQSDWCEDQLKRVLDKAGFDKAITDRAFNDSEAYGTHCEHCDGIVSTSSKGHSECPDCGGDAFELEEGENSYEGHCKAEMRGHPCETCGGIGAICDKVVITLRCDGCGYTHDGTWADCGEQCLECKDGYDYYLKPKRPD